MYPAEAFGLAALLFAVWLAFRVLQSVLLFSLMAIVGLFNRDFNNYLWGFIASAIIIYLVGWKWEELVANDSLIFIGFWIVLMGVAWAVERWSITRGGRG